MFEPSPFHFGFYYNEARDKVDRRRSLDYNGERHILLFGVNGAGKSTRILIENLVTMRGRSLVVFDMKGELAAQTHRARRRMGDVYIINPYDLHRLGSDGYNPLSLLDPDDDEFFDKAKLLTKAIIESEGEANQYFPRSARGWFWGPSSNGAETPIGGDGFVPRAILWRQTPVFRRSEAYAHVAPLDRPIFARQTLSE